MKKNLLGKLTDNLALKIISVVIAIAIWYIVVDYNDPMIQRSISNVEVQVENGAYIANGKRVYHIDEQYKTISVIVEGNRSVVSRLTANDIKVTADMTEAVDLDSDPVYIPLRVSCPGIAQENLTLPRTTIPVRIEDVASREFPITVDTGGTKPAKEYEIGSLKASMDSVTISGPQSIINTIGTVVAEINVNGMNQDGSVKANLKIYDTADNELPESTISDDLSFDGSGMPEIEVNVELWQKRSGVRFPGEGYTGNPAEGYEVTEISTTPEEITVAGTEEALETLKKQGNVIVIPEEMISVEGAEGDLKVDNIEIADLLPEGMITATNASATVTVNVTVLPWGTREFALDVEDISVQNLSSNLAVSYASAEIEVRVQAAEKELEELTGSQITASIDLNGMTEGDYTVPVNISLPEGYEQVDSVQVSIQLRATPDTSQ